MSTYEMTREELATRSAEIDAEMSGEITAERMLQLKEEASELLARSEELREIEERKATATAIENGYVEPKTVETHENEKENRTMFEVNSIEYRDAWVKNLIKRPVSEEERSALASAATVIPTMTVNAVWDKLVKPAELLGRVDVSQFPSYVRFPVATTVNAATGHAVGATITESSDVVGYVDLIPQEYVKLITVKADIENMAISAVHDWLVNNIVDSIRYAINSDLLVGAGTAGCKGITASVAANGTNLPATLTKASLLNVMATLPSNYQPGAVWIMTPALFYNEVMSLTALNDYVIQDGFGTKLFGHDVILMSEALVSTKETIFYGDPKAYKCNIFSALEVKPFESATTTNIQYRGATLADGELIDTNAFVRFAKA